MKQIVNRAVITVTPKAPFIAWVQSADEESARISVEAILENPNAYLVEADEDGTEPEKLIKKNFKMIFEEELNGWITDESMWPKRDLRIFKQWFEVTVHEMVFDLGRSSLFMEDDDAM